MSVHLQGLSQLPNGIGGEALNNFESQNFNKCASVSNIWEQAVEERPTKNQDAAKFKADKIDQKDDSNSGRSNNSPSSKFSKRAGRVIAFPVNALKMGLFVVTAPIVLPIAYLCVSKHGMTS